MTDRPEITVLDDGPILVRGPVVVHDATGCPVESTRPVSAICRCGRSRRAPWCDGTHKLLPNGAATPPPLPSSRER